MATKRSRRPMRLPNGFGSIVHLSGNRRNPYMARPPVTDYFDNGNPITPKAIGYYPDWHSAYEALLEYRKNPYDLDASRITYAEVYEKMVEEKKNLPKALSRSTFQSYQSAFKNSAALHKMRLADIRLSHLQGVIDHCPLKHASLEIIVNLFHQMYDYACKYDICQKDYSAYVKINRPDDDEKGVPFSPKEIQILWQHTDIWAIQVLLVLIYTGFRISEAAALSADFSEWIFQGGVKTKAGKNRTVPIHPAIRTMAEALYLPAGGILGCRVQEYRERMYEALESLKIQKHTPHDCRHTFSWLCDKYGVDPLAKKMLLGHSLGASVTETVYGHRTLDELRIEIEKIQVPKV